MAIIAALNGTLQNHAKLSQGALLYIKWHNGHFDIAGLDDMDCYDARQLVMLIEHMKEMELPQHGSI